MAEDGIHEIQLDGKQLVFLFMAATVVSVVIFLCGVMVGRGVRLQQAELAALTEDALSDPTGEHPDPPAATVPESGSAALQEDLSYPDRLAADGLPPEPLRAPAEPVVARSESPRPVRRPVEPRETREPRRQLPAPRPVDAFTVQVAAVKERGEADAIVRRLTSKGYQAYVTPPAAGAPRVFRVRVGRFPDRRQAETVAARLQKEEQFKPWITR